MTKNFTAFFTAIQLTPNIKSEGFTIITKIDLDPIGRAYCSLMIQQRHSKTMSPLLFKLDTGADFTTVSKTALYEFGYDKEWIDDNKKLLKSKIITLASGEIADTYFIQLPVISLYGYRANNWPFAIIMDDKMDYRPLLGLNLLTYFNMRMDNDNRYYELSHAERKPKGTKLFLNQEIFRAV